MRVVLYVHLSPGYLAVGLYSELSIKRVPLYVYSLHYFSPLPLTVDRLEERCESFKKDLHNRNIDLVKKHQVLKKESTLKRDSRTKLFDEVPAFPLSPNKTTRRRDSRPLHRGDAHVLSQQTRVSTCVQCVSE